MKKRLIALVLALVMVFSLVAMSASAVTFYGSVTKFTMLWDSLNGARNNMYGARIGYVSEGDQWYTNNIGNDAQYWNIVITSGEVYQQLVGNTQGFALQSCLDIEY